MRVAKVHGVCHTAALEAVKLPKAGDSVAERQSHSRRRKQKKQYRDQLHQTFITSFRWLETYTILSRLIQRNQCEICSCRKVSPKDDPNIDVSDRRTWKDLDCHTVLGGMCVPFVATMQAVDR